MNEDSEGEPVIVETSFACANPITRSVSTATKPTAAKPTTAKPTTTKGPKERDIKDVVKDHVVSARRTTSMNSLQSRRTVMTTEL